MPPTLQTLPAEVRFEIYNQLSNLKPEGKIYQDIPDPDFWGDLAPGLLDRRLNRNLCLVSRGLYAEYTDWFFRRGTLKSIIRTFESNTDLFGNLLRRLTPIVKTRIRHCSLVILWKPQDVVGGPVGILREQLESLYAGLPALHRLTVDFRFFDIHDLEEDIVRGKVDVAELKALGRSLKVPEGKLHFSAITKMLTEVEHRGLELDYEVGSIEYMLLAETYVSWRFEHAEDGEKEVSEGGWAWYGLMPSPARFFCYGLEARDMGRLETLVRTAVAAGIGKN